MSPRIPRVPRQVFRDHETLFRGASQWNPQRVAPSSAILTNDPFTSDREGPPPPPYSRATSPSPPYQPLSPLCPTASWEKKYPVNRFNCAEYSAILLEEWPDYLKRQGALCNEQTGLPWSVDDPVKYLEYFREFLVWLMTKEYQLASKYRLSKLTRDAKGYFMKVGLVYWAYEIHHQNHGGMYTENESVHEVVRQESGTSLYHSLVLPCMSLNLPFGHVAYTLATWAGILLNLRLTQLKLEEEMQPGPGFSNRWLNKYEQPDLLRQKFDDDLRVIHITVPNEDEEKKLALIAELKTERHNKFNTPLCRDLSHCFRELRLLRWLWMLRKPKEDTTMQPLSAGPVRAARPMAGIGYVLV